MLPTVKTQVRKLVPSLVLDGYDRFRRFSRRARNSRKSPEQVFTEIYDINRWGGRTDEYYSGAGTFDEEVVSAYVSAIEAKAVSEGFGGLTFVDLGCGDFRVGKRLLSLCTKYVGADVVKKLIEHHRVRYANDATVFMHLDIITDDLPDGDVCFIRQVFQHLSNSQIGAILRKLTKYQWVIITEHYPVDNASIIPNRDKIHGADVRVFDNSGVYLTQPPFMLPAQALELILEIPGVGLGRDMDPGVIRTFIYKPNSLVKD